MRGLNLHRQAHQIALALLLSLLVAAAASLGVRYLSNTNEQARLRVLESQADQVLNLLESRFRTVSSRIRAGAAFLSSSNLVSRDEWRSFVNATEASSGALFEMFWAEVVPASDFEEFQRRISAEGLTDLALAYPQPDEAYCPIVYTEPLDLHRDSIGLNLCAQPVFRAAARQAQQTGRMQTSGSVNLLADTNAAMQGYALLAWVGPGSQHQGGWVGGTIALESLLADIAAYPDLAVGFFDASNPEQALVSINAHSVRRNRALETLRTLTIGERRFNLNIQKPTASEPTEALLLITGWLLATLLGVLLFYILKTRSTAEQLADKATRAYRDTEQLLTSVTGNISEGIYRGVPGKGLVYINQALADMFGFKDAEEMKAQPGSILYASPDQRDELHQLLIQDGAYRNQEVEFIRPDGSHFFAINSAVASLDSDGSISHFDGVVSDITDRKHAEEAAHRLAHYDDLTGLPNRTLLQDRISQAIAHAGRSDRSLAVMFMDLDRFKSVNDSLGHGIGDQLLVAVSQRLVDTLRQYDTISRLGGDEFVIVMPGAGFDAATQKATSLIRQFREMFEIEGHELVITPSIGIAIYPEDGEQPETLLRNADTAMYHAKERGRATFEFFTTELNQRAYERLSMETHLRSALDNNELHLVYQPLVKPDTGEICAAEVLLRWNSPILGRVGPDQFIPVAEQSGQIVDIGRWVIESALKQLASWRRLGMSELKICVNVSAVQFWRGNLSQTVQRALEQSNLSGSDLEIELTENVIMSDLDKARDVLAELRPLGVRLAIDDFGTGYSSLSYLKQFRVDRLKIDKSFVRDLKTDTDDAAIVSAVLSMARDLRVEVVAEGVETEEQLAFLAERRCDLIQGYYFSRPLPPTDFMRLWARTNQALD
jgi:diguanylate cyclase (GGDEF)-like protein/PAS domain S-box-containing protein